MLPLVNSNPKIDFEVVGRGVITIELYVNEAPETTKHFMTIVKQHAYHGMLWHRLVPGFVLQTGDPLSKAVLPEEARAMPGERGGTQGLGDTGYGPTIKFEKNDLSHVKGTVGMALESPGDDSGSSHFFINLEDNTRLDGKYVVFGKVSEGWDVVTKTKRGDLIRSAKIRN